MTDDRSTYIALAPGASHGAEPATGVDPGAEMPEYDFEDMTRLLRTMPLPNHLGGGLCKQAADAIDYLWAQDGLLSQAQDDAQRLREQLAEVERPLDQQMARLNDALIAANIENAKLKREAAKASPAAVDEAWLENDSTVLEVDAAIDRATLAAKVSGRTSDTRAEADRISADARQKEEEVKTLLRRLVYAAGYELNKQLRTEIASLRRASPPTTGEADLLREIERGLRRGEVESDPDGARTTLTKCWRVIESLVRERDNLDKICQGYGKNIHDLQTENASLRAKLDERDADAERLDWLDAQRQDEIDRGGGQPEDEPQLLYCYWQIQAQAMDLRTAIDMEIEQDAAQSAQAASQPSNPDDR